MQSYWCQFTNHQSQTINANTQTEASDIALERLGERPASIRNLPYPALPELNPGECPAFCYSPTTCAGRGSCPRDYACSE